MKSDIGFAAWFVACGVILGAGLVLLIAAWADREDD